MQRLRIALRAPRTFQRRAFSGVPTIDVGPYFKGTPQGKRQVAEAFGRACEDTGFLSITNHNVDPAIIDNAWKITRAYFDLPVATKNEILMTPEYPYGYSGVGEENLAKGYAGEVAAPDLKEVFSIGPSNPAALMPAIQWPRQPEGFVDAWRAYYAEMERLSTDLLRVAALALDLDEKWFDDKIDHHRSCLRALNYPETKTKPLPGQIRAGQHTDYGSLTILLQDSIGGLQVQGKNGQWVDVGYVPGSFVINIGDLMAMWTNDKWKSTLHRVVCPSDIPGQASRANERRQSMAFFHNINHDHVVSCIPTCASPTNPPRHAPIAAWDHLMQKHLASTTH